MFDLDELVSLDGPDEPWRSSNITEEESRAVGRTVWFRGALGAVRQQIFFAPFDTPQLVRELTGLEERIDRLAKLNRQMFAAARAGDFDRAKSASRQVEGVEAEMHEIVSRSPGPARRSSTM